MPLYEYHCSKCGRNFEVLQKFSDAPLAVHEECGGAVERVLSAPAFQLKGSGWYVTDYGKGGSKPGESGEKKSDAKSESSGESKAESKSESKPETKSDSKSSPETKAPAKP